MDRLKNKVAAVTGGGGGIGRACAKFFGAEGAAVVVTDLIPEMAEKVAKEIRDEGGQAIGLKVDAGEEADLKAMVDATISEFGRIDVLLNNAADTASPQTSAKDRDFLTYDTEVFYRRFRINTLSGVLACKFSLPHMLKQGAGSIIWTTSTSSTAGEVYGCTYGATKAAVNWFTQAIAANYGKEGIRSNGIMPGAMVTEAQQGWSSPEMDKALLEIQNVPRLGLPEDIAHMAVFLASDESLYCNGSIYQVNGGMTCITPMVPIARKFFPKK